MVILQFPFKLISKSNDKGYNRAGRPFKAKKFREFEQHIRSEVLSRSIPYAITEEGALSFTIHAYFKTKVHCDIVNSSKGVADALQGLIYKNDRQIKESHVLVKSEEWHDDCFEVVVEKI